MDRKYCVMDLNAREFLDFALKSEDLKRNGYDLVECKDYDLSFNHPCTLVITDKESNEMIIPCHPSLWLNFINTLLTFENQAGLFLLNIEDKEESVEDKKEQENDVMSNLEMLTVGFQPYSQAEPLVNPDGIVFDDFREFLKENRAYDSYVSILKLEDFEADKKFVLIFQAFRWSTTKEGWVFWHNLSEKWIDLCNK